jgi:hypothetical protein
MGNNSTNSQSHEYKDKLRAINRLTSSELFLKKTGFIIKFVTKDNDIFNELFDKPPVFIAYLSTIVDGVAILEKEKRLNTVDFMKFYSITMKSIPIFINEKKIKQNINDEEDNICSICDVNKSNILLDCMHCFCSGCIETWLFQKKNDCPFCRKTINLNNYDKDAWDIIEFNNDNKEEFIQNANVEFYKTFHSLILDER